MEETSKMTLTVAGIVFSLWTVMFGYVMNRIKKIEDKQSSIDCSNTNIQTQLSQIQTDISWIKMELSNSNKKK
jgi:peptidoglycan hydrolase CwlO-like protein